MIDVIFGDYRSYTDFGLVLEDMDIPPASPKTNYVDIPGGDGSIDLTEAFGEVKYNDRELEFAFSCRKEDFETKKRIVANAIHGKRMRVSTTVDPGYYYQGRVYIDSYETSAVFGRIVVKAIVEPYKYHGGEMAWHVNAPGTATIPNDGTKAAIPTITASAVCDVEINGIKTNVPAGTSRYMGFSINPGSNQVRVSNVGSRIARPYSFEEASGNPMTVYDTDTESGESYPAFTLTATDNGMILDRLVDMLQERTGDIPFHELELEAGTYVLNCFDSSACGYYAEYKKPGSTRVTRVTDWDDELNQKHNLQFTLTERTVVTFGIWTASFTSVGKTTFSNPRMIGGDMSVIIAFQERDL